MRLFDGGFGFGEDIDGLSEQAHAEGAEEVVETLIVARTPNVNLRGWVYFELFGKSHAGEDAG